MSLSLNRTTAKRIEHQSPSPTLNTILTLSRHAANVRSVQDYYPFGMHMPGRSFVSGEGYRYGFNGMERDDVIKGEGNSYDFGARIYDSRPGRWWKIDDLVKHNESPYSSFANSPIYIVDIDGNDSLIIHRSPLLLNKSTGLTNVFIVTFSYVEKGVEKQVSLPNGQEFLLMFSSAEHDLNGDNYLNNRYYKLRYEQMSHHRDIKKIPKTEIRVGTFDLGVFIHMGEDYYYSRGCKILCSSLKKNSTGEPATTSKDSYSALDQVKKFCDSVKKELTGEKFLLKTDSYAPMEKIDPIPPMEIERDIEEK